jgi:hypothetical protein
VSRVRELPHVVPEPGVRGSQVGPQQSHSRVELRIENEFSDGHMIRVVAATLRLCLPLLKPAWVYFPQL